MNATPVTESRPVPIERVLGISFFNGSGAAAVEQFQKVGGYMVAPVSPGLTKLRYDAEYQRALCEADLAIANSGLLVMLWKLISGRRLTRISALAYLKCLLQRGEILDSASWIVSSPQAKTKTIDWLRQTGAPVDAVYVVGPKAGTAEHYDLLEQIEAKRPENIIFAVGGGAQEKIALYLRDHLLYRPKIHCLGAALGFLTGEERPIPDWADRAYLGWLFRILSQPRMLLPRLWSSFELAGMLLKFRAEPPVLQAHWVDA